MPPPGLGKSLFNTPQSLLQHLVYARVRKRMLLRDFPALGGVGTCGVAWLWHMSSRLHINLRHMSVRMPMRSVRTRDVVARGCARALFEVRVTGRC